MNKRIQKAIAKHGEAACKEAYKLNLVDGEGGSTIAIYLGVRYNQVSGMYDAGEWLHNQPAEVSPDGLDRPCTVYQCGGVWYPAAVVNGTAYTPYLNPVKCDGSCNGVDGNCAV